MRWRRRSFPLLLAVVTACAPAAKPGVPAGDPFVVAQEQALELGKALAGMRLCEGIAWQIPYYEFMDLKSQRGLNDTQTAMIAAMTGTGEAQAEPDMLVCTPEGAARRAEALSEMRGQW